jgi:hypothetical protein
MAAVMHHHHVHVPASVSRAAHGVERVVWGALFALLPPVAFALLILSGLLLALGLAKIL